MDTLTTNGIKVSVETFYQAEQSSARESRYVYAYRVTIENKSNKTVQLLRRHWYIINSIGPNREVEGEGVIGKQPVIQPGEIHQYISGTIITSDIGKMYGTYLLLNKKTNRKFRVSIPHFKLIAPFKNS